MHPIQIQLPVEQLKCKDTLYNNTGKLNNFSTVFWMLNNFRFCVSSTKIKLTESSIMYVKQVTKMKFNLKTLIIIFNTEINKTTVGHVLTFATRSKLNYQYLYYRSANKNTFGGSIYDLLGQLLPTFNQSKYKILHPLPCWSS